MTNSCYCPRVYNMYRGGDPVKLNLYCRKRIRNRLFYRLFRGRMYWGTLDVLYKIHEIHRTMVDTDHRIHYFMRRIVRFVHRSVKVFLKLEAPIRVA